MTALARINCSDGIVRLVAPPHVAMLVALVRRGTCAIDCDDGPMGHDPAPGCRRHETRPACRVHLVTGDMFEVEAEPEIIASHLATTVRR